MAHRPATTRCSWFSSPDGGPSVQDAIPRVLADDFDPRAAEMLVDRLPEK